MNRSPILRSCETRSFCLLLAFALLLACPALAGDGVSTARAYGSVGGVLDISFQSDGKTGFLAEIPVRWMDLSTDTTSIYNLAILGSEDVSGNLTNERFYGPYGGYGGWAPRAMASSPDGLSRVLWRNDDGRWGVWLLDSAGVLSSFASEAEPGLTAQDVAAGIAGQTHVLLAGPDGASLRTIDGQGISVSNVPIGFYPGWTPAAISDGADGLTRLLWNNSDGRTGLSLVSSDGIVSTARYAPESGWKALDVAVGGDGLTRILRVDEGRRVALWIADAGGTISAYGPAYQAPTGFNAQRLAAGQDGSSRILLEGEGNGLVWLMSAEGVFQDSFVLLVPWWDY